VPGDAGGLYINQVFPEQLPEVAEYYFSFYPAAIYGQNAFGNIYVGMTP